MLKSVRYLKNLRRKQYIFGWMPPNSSDAFLWKLSTQLFVLLWLLNWHTKTALEIHCFFIYSIKVINFGNSLIYSSYNSVISWSPSSKLEAGAKARLMHIQSKSFSVFNAQSPNIRHLLKRACKSTTKIIFSKCIKTFLTL